MSKLSMYLLLGSVSSVGVAALLADLLDPTALKPWLDLLVSYGVPMIVTVFALWLAWRYVPPFIDSSLKIPDAIRDLTATLKDALNLMREAVTTIKQVQEDSNSARGMLIASNDPDIILQPVKRNLPDRSVKPTRLTVT